MQQTGAIGKGFVRRGGIYRSDVSLLLVNLGQRTALRSGPDMLFRVLASIAGLHLTGTTRLKKIAASKETDYYRTINSLFNVCLSPRGGSIHLEFGPDLHRKDSLT
jgi:hypothetical protein